MESSPPLQQKKLLAKLIRNPGPLNRHIREMQKASKVKNLTKVALSTAMQAYAVSSIGIPLPRDVLSLSRTFVRDSFSIARPYAETYARHLMRLARRAFRL